VEHREREPTIINAVSLGLITICTRPLNIEAIKVARPNAPVTSYRKRVKGAGTRENDGG
jgi:hypothetical protein